MDDLPLQGGIYTLLFAVYAPQTIEIGKLGAFKIPVGIYAYQGSAQGSGGLKARLGRHWRALAKLHWHIDYLRMKSEVVGYIYYILREKNIGNLRAECAWNQALFGLDGATVPVPGFGASDCESGCVAHLVHLSAMVVLDYQLQMKLTERLSSMCRERDERSKKKLFACYHV